MGKTFDAGLYLEIHSFHALKNLPHSLSVCDLISLLCFCVADHTVKPNVSRE